MRFKGLPLVLVIVFILTLIMVSPAATQEVEVERNYGMDRFETAVEISKAGWTSSETVILARSDDFPDALAGTPLAYQEDAPVLLTSPDRLNSTTRAEMERLGAERVIILGGPAAIAEEVEGELLNLGLEVERIGGDNRYETAALIAEEMPEAEKAILAYGGNFPDALAIGPYAAQEGYPVLLTRTDSIPGATDEVLGGVDATILVGGIAVISEAVYQEAPDPTRIAGEDRFDTAAHIISQLDIPVDKAYVATGMDFADALTGSALAAKDNASVLLARGERVPEPLEEIIEDEEIDDFTILGGPGAISEAVELQLLGEEAVVEPGEMIFHFFDVGQGDSILIETPCESYVLVDGGPRGAGDDLVSYLNALGVERLDKVVATHEHEDHIGGLISLYESPLEVETTYGSQYQHDTITAENFRDLAQEESNFITAAAFDTLNIDCEYTEMTFIHPYEGASGDIHYMNLVLNIEHQEVSALITGDAEEEAETAMMENASEYLPSDILKVGHHGSRTSTSQPFLDVVSPGTAVIQVGEDNRYGHPHQETLDRLTQAGVDIYRNDISGTLVIASDGTEYEVDTDPYVYHPEDPEPEPHPEPVPGRININTASLEELQEIIHIGPGRAQEIIDLRPFNSLEELTRVSGIGPARLEDIKAEGIAYVE